MVPKEVIKQDLFPSHEATQGRVRGYQVTWCKDPIITSMIYPSFLSAHGYYPNNDQITLYFPQELYAKFCMGLNVNYLDILDY